MHAVRLLESQFLKERSVAVRVICPDPILTAGRQAERILQNEPILPRKLGSRTHLAPFGPAKSSCFGFRDTHAFLRVIEKLFSRRKCLVCVQPSHHKGTYSVSVRRPYRTKKNPLAFVYEYYSAPESALSHYEFLCISLYGCTSSKLDSVCLSTAALYRTLRLCCVYSRTGTAYGTTVQVPI